MKRVGWGNNPAIQDEMYPMLSLFFKVIYDGNLSPCKLD